MPNVASTRIEHHKKFLDTTKNDTNPDSKEYFHNVVCGAIEMSLIDCKSLAEKFGVNKGTISRWANKKTLPHPMVRPVIVEWVREQVKNNLNALLITRAKPDNKVAAHASACQSSRSKTAQI